jgi:hypothetical protein
VSQDDPVPDAVADHWNELLADARATAAEYRDRGWDVLLIHTADATVVDAELDVLAPDNEYDDLTELADEGAFDSSRAFVADEGGIRFLLIVVEATDDEIAVAIPAYFPIADEPQLRDRGRETGTLSTRVRALGAESHVTFTHEDPAIFFPERTSL